MKKQSAKDKKDESKAMKKHPDKAQDIALVTKMMKKKGKIMAYTGRIAWETLRVLPSASLIPGTKVAIGTPLLHPSYKLKIVNNGSTLVTVSVDGINDVDVLPATSIVIYDEGTVGLSGGFPAIPKGTQFYLDGTAGTDSIYIVSQYIVN